MASREEADRLLTEAQRKHDEASRVHADAKTKAAEIDGRIEGVKAKFRRVHATLMGEVETL